MFGLILVMYVLQWIKNKDLRLDRFISPRIEKICLLSKSEDWRYCPTNLNPADVASRPNGVKKPETRRLWFEGTDFLKQNREIPNCECVSVSVNRVAYSEEKGKLYFPKESPIDRLIETAPSLYVLTKRVAYLRAFVEYLRCKFKKRNFVRPKWDTCDLNKALNKIVAVVQKNVLSFYFISKFILLTCRKATETLINRVGQWFPNFFFSRRPLKT